MIKSAKYAEARWIPEGSAKVASKISGAVVYMFPSKWGGKPAAVGYYGKAVKPAFNYSFKDDARRAKWVSEWLQGQDAAVKAKAARVEAKKAALAKPHGLKVGDVLRSSWGYDQTNIDYYEVIELVGKRGVKICEIGCESVETGFMQGNSVPAKGAFIGQPMLKKVGERDEVKVRDFGVWAYKMEPMKSADGIAIGYRPSGWTAYA